MKSLGNLDALCLNRLGGSDGKHLLSLYARELRTNLNGRIRPLFS